MNWQRMRRSIAWFMDIVAAAALVGSTFIVSGGVAVAQAAPAARTTQTVPAQAAIRITKVTLPETSIDGPSLASLATTSVIGWTGTDAAHHLNVEISRDGLNFDRSTKLILNETSPFRPDVGLFSENTAISIAWTGTDANHSLNFLPITDSGGTFTLGTKQVLSQFSSNAGPHLVQIGPNSVALCWTSRSGQPKVAVAGGDLRFRLAATLPEATAFAPSMLFRTSGDWIAWTGLDSAHRLNLEATTTFPSFPNPKTILGDTAFGGPALGINGGNQIAWTGTDPAHHLNVAKFA